MKTKKTVIFMGYSCNNNCVFCCNSEKRNCLKDKTLEEIKKDLISSRKNGSNYIELIGGEPTIRRDILEIVEFAKKLGFGTIMFATNGRMFSNKEFARKIIEKGVNHIVFSIHGHNPEIHDNLTRVQGSFNQLIKGIENLREIGFDNIGSNTTIVKQNYLYLSEIGKVIYNLGIRNSEFIFVDPTHGASKQNFHEIVPTYEEVSPYINDLLKFGDERKIRHWHIRYYPLCFVNKEYHNRISETHEKQVFHTEHIAPDFINEDVIKNREEISRVKINKCGSCEYGNICEGYWREYVKNYLNKEEIYKSFFNDLKKMHIEKYKNIEIVENHFFSLLNKDLLNKSKPLEYSVKLDKKGFHTLRFLFFSHDKTDDKSNNKTDEFIDEIFKEEMPNKMYFSKYAFAYDIRDDILIKKYYFWVKENDKVKAFEEFNKLYNLNKKLGFPINDLEIISIKKLGNKTNYNFYSTFEESDKNKVSEILNKAIPMQILQKENNQETILRLSHLTPKEKTQVLSENIFTYYFIKKHKSFFINNSLSLSYLTYSNNSIKFYFKVGGESESALDEFDNMPNYNRFNITLTQECNLNCKYCFVPKKRNSQINLNTFNLILDLFNMVDSGFKLIGLWGGEPLILRDCLKEYIKLINKKFSSEKNFCIHLVINGTLLNNKILDYLTRIGVFLSISIDGDKDTHDKSRRLKNNSSSYNILDNKKELIKKYSEKIICNPVVDEVSSKNIISNIKHINKIFGINKFHLEFLMKNNWDKSKINELRKNTKLLFEWLINGINKGDFIYVAQLNKKILNKLDKIPYFEALCFFQNGDFSNDSWSYYKHNERLGNVFSLEFKKNKIIPETIQASSILEEFTDYYSDLILRDKDKPNFKRYVKKILDNPLRYL